MKSEGPKSERAEFHHGACGGALTRIREAGALESCSILSFYIRLPLQSVHLSMNSVFFHGAFNPLQVVKDVSVDSGSPGSGTRLRSSRHYTCQGSFAHQGSPRVTLARASATLPQASAQHLLRDVARVCPAAELVVQNANVGTLQCHWIL